MSLFDALVDDAVLSRPVMQQNYYIALRTDGAKGSGTFDDPWNGSTQAMFDAAMGAVPENSTVFLGPASFDSNGNPTLFFQSKGYPAGFAVKSGQRIVGAGRDVTIIKLTGHLGGVQNSVFGMPFASGSDFLYGFEVSNLTVDANLPSAYDCAAGAVNVTGKHVLIKGVRVKNYGSRTVGLDCTVISPARASSVCPVPPSNCVVDDCVVDPPSVHHTQTATVFALLTVVSAGITYYHETCVIRNNYVNAGYTSPTGPYVKGITAVGARGAIIENNRIVNCKYGGPFYDISMGGNTEDLVVRDNFYSNVLCGVILNFVAMQRIIVEDNIIDLCVDGGTYGIFVSGPTFTTALDVVVVRGNRIRGLNGLSLGSPSFGILIGLASRLTIENNIVDTPLTAPDDAVRVTDCVSTHVFNNRRINGDLARVVNTNTGLYVPELTTDAEDVLLSL
jgi:hypothetical protein